MISQMPVPDLTAGEDQGLKVVASHIEHSETRGPAGVTWARHALGGMGAFLGFGDGAVGWLMSGTKADALAIIAQIGATPISAAADADGASILVGTDDGRLLSISSSGDVSELARAEGHWIEQVAVHAESRTRAYTVGRELFILDAGGTQIAHYDSHESTIAGLAYSPDGSAIAAAHYEGISVHYPGKAGKSSDLLEWHGSHTAVSWSPDGRFIVSAMQENEMHCWRMPQKKGMRMSGYPTKIRALSWTHDGTYMAASGADTVTSWNFTGKGPSGKTPAEFGYVFNETVVQVAAHPAEATVAGGYSDGTVLIGSIENETCSIARPAGGGKVTALNWAPDGGSLIIGTERGEVAVCRITGAMA